MLILPPPLLPLAEYDQFVTWIAVPHPETPGKFNKFPTDWRTGHVINAQDPQYWTSAACALAVASGQDRGHGSGAGFVFTPNDPFFFQDVDGALEADGQWSGVAQDLCNRLNGAAVEISHSGRGLHVFGRCSKPVVHACKNIPLGLELYTEARFCALTGTSAIGDASLDCSASLAGVVAQYFVPTATGDWAGWTTEPVPEWSGPDDDTELLRRMQVSGQRSAAAVFGGQGALTFNDLWTRNEDAIRQRWPTGWSDADMALANHLAFWTGKNCERMERLMRASALVRDKWDAHRTYLADTILKACAYVGKVAQDKAKPDPVTVPPPAPEVLAAAAEATGRQLRAPNTEYMGPQDQLTRFAGCYFLTEPAMIFSLPENGVFKKTSFDVVHGGHLFVMDPLGQKTTDSAWDAFTLSRVNKPVIVADMCFRPELAPGAIAAAGDKRLVNSYVPHVPAMTPGDVSKFTGFLAKLLPDAHDRAILLNYMASLTQNPGRKFQWWPVLQGIQGNGKTWLLSVLTYCMGEQYTHLPNALAMAREGIKFNSWIYRKLFIGVEEVKVSGKWDFLEEFKAVITNARMGMEPKGVDQVTRDNRANGMLCTNHKEGVPITARERRYALFFTAQQHLSDLARDGMDGNYFPDLYDWFEGRGEYEASGRGAAAICHYLTTFPIDAALDPAGACHRAPTTTSTADAIELSLGRVEQEIRDAIEEGRPGFAGGWVSSFFMDEMIERLRVAVPRSKRRALMQDLGYDWHPALKDGRVNDVIMPDNRKPKLFVRHGHLSLNQTSAAEVQRAYTRAQEARGASPDTVFKVAG
jgi:hypothetical protein